MILMLTIATTKNQENKHSSNKIKLTRISQKNTYNDRKNSLNDNLETYTPKPFERKDAIAFLNDIQSDFHIPFINSPSLYINQNNLVVPSPLFPWGGPCNNRSCKSCNILENAGVSFKSAISSRSYPISDKDIPMDCKTNNVIYLISCSRCQVQYVGQTSQSFNRRMSQHRSNIKLAKNRNSLLAQHFNGDFGCHSEHFTYKIIERILPDKNSTKEELTRKRKNRETFWMKELRTVTPYGINNNCDSKDWANLYKETDIVANLFNTILPLKGRLRGCRGRRKNKKSRKPFNFSRFLNTVLFLFKDGNNWRLWAKKVILSLSNKIVRKLIWKIGHIFDYDNFPSILKKFILDCVKYKIHRAIHSSKKQDRHYIKIKYLNKIMDKIHLDCIFCKSLKTIKVKLKYHENPTIVWLRTNIISSKVHNFISIANDTKVQDWATKSSNTCDCKNSKFCNVKLGHIVTGDLDFIKHLPSKSLLSKGAKFREPKFIDWDLTWKEIYSAVELYCNTWSATENKQGGVAIRTWFSNVMDLVKLRIDKLKKNFVERNFNFYEKLNSKKIKKALAVLHGNFVVTSTDKAMNNFSIICKKFYIETMLDELGIRDPTCVNGPPHLIRSVKTYIRVKEKNVDTIVKDHMSYLSENFPLLQLMQGLPFLMWTAKMHKTPPSQRFIAISSRCTTKPLSVLITLGLNRVLGQWRTHANFVKKDHGISPMWVIDNSNDIHKRITLINNTFKANDADTFDFSTLFTGIEHTDLSRSLRKW